jgi:hypothetical protein
VVKPATVGGDRKARFLGIAFDLLGIAAPAREPRKTPTGAVIILVAFRRILFFNDGR